MRQALVRRLEHLEERQAGALRLNETLSTFEVARRVLATVREGLEAKEELAAANGSLDPERRAELTKRLKAAREIAAAFSRYSQAKEIGIAL